MITYIVIFVVGFYSLISSLRTKGMAIQSFNYKHFLLFLILTTFTLIHCPTYAHPSFDVNNALKALDAGDLDTAESNLQKARFEEPDSYIINYDLGIVSYRKRDYAKSIRFFAKASEVSKTVDERFDSFYNMGNAAFKAYDFALAVDAYKNALSIKKNYQAEYNLEVAEKKLKEMLERMKKEQEQQQQQQQNQQQNQDNKQNQKDGQKKDNSQKSDSNNSQNQKDNQSQKQQEQNQQNQESQNQQNQQQGQKENQDNQQQQSSENNSERNQQASEYDDNQSQDEKQKEGQNSNNSEENKEESKEEQKQASNSEDKDSENQQDKDNQEKQNSEEKNEQADNQNNPKEQSAQSSEEQKENEAQKDDNQKEAQTPINEEKIAPEEDRRDVKMAEDKGKVSRPEASKKARDLKKMKLSAKDYKSIEEVLKNMEARENEYQKYYRINNIEEKNPAYMDPEELKEWIKVRTKKRERQNQGQQDW